MRHEIYFLFAFRLSSLKIDFNVQEKENKMEDLRLSPNKKEMKLSESVISWK